MLQSQKRNRPSIMRNAPDVHLKVYKPRMSTSHLESAQTQLCSISCVTFFTFVLASHLYIITLRFLFHSFCRHIGRISGECPLTFVL